MPGHKFGLGGELEKINLLVLDNTEARGMDNLYEAGGIIKEAMELMADFYGSKETVFLTNGSTSGIIASILSLCKEGDEIIIARNAHHSVWNALVLGGIKPIYISPQYIKEKDILGEITAHTVEEALKMYPNAKGVLIVSPTYEGIVSDIRAISEIVHQYNKVLIVDEAHGAHFILSKDFPMSSIHQGADLVINSMHKTLPALTQSGLLHICSNKIEYDEIIESLRMIQTSSPSYMMMGVMDYIRDYIIENRKRIQSEYIDVLLKFRRQLADHLKHLKIIDMDKEKYDISKIVISTLNTNINGYQLAEILYLKYDISIEAALQNYIILMTTMADNKKSMELLVKVLKEIDDGLCLGKNEVSINNFFIEEVAPGISPRTIYYSKKEWVDDEQAVGRIAAKNIMLYPPGIPLVCIGEVIKKEHIAMIKLFKNEIQGIRLVNDEVIFFVL